MNASRWLFGALFFAAACVWGQAQTLIAWDLEERSRIDENLTGPTYAWAGTVVDSNIAGGSLTLSSAVNPSTSDQQYGFKIGGSDGQTTLAGAIAEDHFLQFTLTAESGYTFSVSALSMNGESSDTGADDIAVFTSVDGFADGDEIASLTGISGEAGGFDTDSSGFGSSITLSGMRYENLSSLTFRIYGWNTSSGSGVTNLRDLVGDDLVISGTTALSAVPEPSTYATLAGVAALGLAACRRRRQQAQITT